MSDNSNKAVAATLAAAVFAKGDITDQVDGVREIFRLYRSLLRRLDRAEETKAPDA